MSLLDEADSFRACQFEISHGVNASFALIEDSIHQYSRARLQRHSQARQRVEPKETKDGAVKGEEEIDATISVDSADGQTTILDESLKLLSDVERPLLVPSDELDDDEIHIIETEFSDHASSQGDHALQDYQMQLMLLEQQNRKRLLIAGQRHRSIQDAGPTGAAPIGVKKLYDKYMHNKERFQILMTKESSLDCKSTQVAPIMPPTRDDIGTGPMTRKRKRAGQSQNQCSDNESKDIVIGNDSNTELGELVERMPPHFDLIYMVSCRDNSPGIHPAQAFRDAPIPRPSATSFHPNGLMPSASLSHLNGAVPIFDLDGFMSDDTDGKAFVVVRTVECSETSILKVRAGVPLSWTQNIYMKSKIAKNAMQEIAKCYFQPIPVNDKDIYGSQPPQAPFEQNQIRPTDLVLFHHRQSLENYVLQHPAAKQHIESLFEYMESWYGLEFSEAESLFTRGLVTHEHVLKLFRPNELVVSGTHGRPAAFVVQEWPTLGNDGWVTITCWSFQTDGSGFARKRSILSIPSIEGATTEIQNLPVYPLRFAAPGVRDSILAHAKKQWELRTTTQVTYKGWNVKRDEYFPNARFMIDHGIYRKMHQNALAFNFDRPTATHPFDRMPAYLHTGQKPSDTSLLLLPPDIHGFYLNEKKWVHLFVDSIHPVSWNKKAYERLVLPSRTKDLVRALVAVRTSQKGVKQGIGIAGKRTDITAGKGNGLIMLLHGGPGTGKTLTAESVAEIAEMPLYRVTCGDIGTNAEAVEKYLNTVLHLGKVWNCVLLLDEADVFLEERSMADLKRNSLVSVFLRILEYYDGILILTSNRVGMFDEAFKSRIQVALHYENLNRSARKKIWENFIEMLEEDEEDVNFDEIKFHLDDLAGKELNGRQIRNVLTTARQLAIYRNERLDWEHLTQALSVSSDFSAYLKRMQGHSDDQRARDIGLR